ncbi:MAG TPA: hypothetical protein GX714_13320 [Chloroflexi bacterium]|nr:hypothetical protein [Chloroflexota bacterium]
MATNGKPLDYSTLSGWLWDAACVIRGPVDAPNASAEGLAGIAMTE